VTSDEAQTGKPRPQINRGQVDKRDPQVYVSVDRSNMETSPATNGLSNGHHVEIDPKITLIVQDSPQIVQSAPVGSKASVQDSVDSKAFGVKDFKEAGTRNEIKGEAKVTSSPPSNSSNVKVIPVSEQQTLTLTFAQRPLAKFKQLEALAEAESKSAVPRKQSYKWDVKQPCSLHGPINSFGYDHRSTTQPISAQHYSATTDSIPDRKEQQENCSMEDMKRLLVQFRAMEDSTLPPPLPLAHSASRGNSLGLYGVGRQSYYDQRGVITVNDLAVTY